VIDLAYSISGMARFVMNEVLTLSEMGRADALAIAGGLSAAALMQAAGRAVARAIMARYAPVRTLVLCGPGNNGGDGQVVARLLAQAGWPVKISTPLADARGVMADIARAGLIIDAVFGAGLSRDITPPLADILRAASGKILVAIDMPSGIDGASGAVRGFAPQADLTVTFFRLKPGHLLYPGRGLCGTVLCRDIGIPPALLNDIQPQTWRNGPALWTLPEDAPGDHKYRRGTVSVLAGSMPGAAMLAAMAARRVGAGMVTVCGQDLHPPMPGLMVNAALLADLLADARRRVWLAGPGLGVEQAGALLAQLIAAGDRTIIADADALTACKAAPARLRGTAVITPHEGEFIRVFGPVGENRLAAARRAAALSGAVVVLKGADTVIADPAGRACINDNAPASLATGGTGDVLAGIIAGLLARGMAPYEASCAAVWLHGAAASYGGLSLIADDLPDLLSKAMILAMHSART
jgi:hydroxyethylthiazole kinase-like uncharacterized protein yjeF